jgi:1,2-diacylglycerol 3-alpha-glucosyltransferase
VKEKAKGALASVLFDTAFVSGRRAAAYLRTLGYQPAWLEIGYDVVDNKYFEARASYVPRKEASSQNRPFLFVGRLDPVKNLKLLLESFSIYRQEGGRRKLKIVGAGPLDQELRRKATCADLRDAVDFEGYQKYEQLPDHYAHAYCLILPSLSEPWGLVVNEAMASGLPVIVSDRCGCADELVDQGENGLVFPAEDRSALVQCLHRIDALNQQQWEMMGLRSQQIVRSFSPQCWAEAVGRLVEEHAKCKAAA